MAAFKTANPTAVFEDFIRWHSPRDWIEEDVYEDSLDAFNDSDSNGVSTHSSYPVKGKLSERMSHPENMWVKLWESVEPLPRSKQKPLFDYTREGEKVSLSISAHALLSWVSIIFGKLCFVHVADHSLSINHC